MNLNVTYLIQIILFRAAVLFLLIFIEFRVLNRTLNFSILSRERGSKSIRWRSDGIFVVHRRRAEIEMITFPTLTFFVSVSHLRWTQIRWPFARLTQFLHVPQLSLRWHGTHFPHALRLL